MMKLAKDPFMLEDHFAAQRQHLQRILRLANELSAGVRENRERWQEQLTGAAQHHVSAREHLQRQLHNAVEQLGDQLTAQLEAARLRFEAGLEQIETQRSQRSDEASRLRSTTIAAANEDAEHAVAQRKDQRAHDRKQLRERLAQFIERCEAATTEWTSVRAAAEAQWRLRQLDFPQLEFPEATSNGSVWSSTLLRQHEAALLHVTETLQSIRHLRAEQYLRESWTVLVLLGAILVTAWPAGIVTGYHPLAWIAACLGISLLTAAVSHGLALRSARGSLRQGTNDVVQELRIAAQSLAQANRTSRSEAQAAKEELERTYRADLEATEAARVKAIADAEQAFQVSMHELEQSFDARLAQLQTAWDDEAAGLRARYRPQQAQQQRFFENLLGQEDTNYQRLRDRVEADGRETEAMLLERWQTAVDDLNLFSRELWRQSREASGGHETLDATTWQPPSQPATTLSVGHYTIPLPALADQLAQRALPEPTPAVLTFPEHGSVALFAEGHEGQVAAIQSLQNATLRYLASLPPGKVRLTICDPVGLGQNFASFMHLADYDERLVGHRIWTEATQIQQRLIDLTEHMENVIQKYLRNEFASIQQYNDHAGEVAEPFRVLVIAGFPHQFTEESTRRLMSILTSGARCGVYTLLAIDDSAALPKNLTLEKVKASTQSFRWHDDRWIAETDPFSDLVLQLDPPPADAKATELIKRVGHLAKDTQRVQVPFSYVAPPADSIWQTHSDDQLVVPLGRVGATQQLALRLGHGTSQHVLISGKTGSGKSNLLNAMITNAALHYGPDQLQFYLIDFKKGVEFKAYAEYRLPHARVIAIESEREFGLSVLQRLDQELRHRGDQFRQQRVQNLAAFRARCPDVAMPRILLIVDEFQEFFVNDDRVAHEASLLLDRLVRQGRAFGIHIVLGSQTLAGAYSLARSTIGQMGVRIALECSSADAHLILSEDNSAARLLGRPGEAIYNDTNGSVEGNHPFQVVWLPDEERNAQLERIQQRADLIEQPSSVGPDPLIVFEGHAAADLSENHQLTKRWEHGPSAADLAAPCVWLGAAIEIKDPTKVTFSRQGGSNLLIVGQAEELASGILGSSIHSLLALAGPGDQAETGVGGMQLVILEAAAQADDHQGWSGLLMGLQQQVTQHVTVAGPRDADATLEQWAEVLETRLADPLAAHPPAFLIVHDLARFRSLQASSDGFGLGGFGGETPQDPAGQLARILREGPAVGIHTLLWADCYHTLSRWFERATLRDFGHRVLMQMSAVDSSHLMDSAAAAQLGSYRAILHDHDRGTMEKFRPYAATPIESLRREHTEAGSEVLSENS
jgi:hypothetical protein